MKVNYDCVGRFHDAGLLFSDCAGMAGVASWIKSPRPSKWATLKCKKPVPACAHERVWILPPALAGIYNAPRKLENLKSAQTNYGLFWG